MVEKSMTPRPTRRRAVTTAAACLALAVPAVVGTTTSTVQALAADPARDGSSSSTAAASCWEAKSAGGDASGLYWLQTPAMVAPQQFYCDQQTDGGGWVLIGRGRNGWGWSPNGQGTPEDLRETVTGRAAFTPDALSAQTITELLNGASPVGLDDGMRLRRARNDAGTQWQEARLRLSKTTPDGTAPAPWSWAMPGKMPLVSWQIGQDGGTGTTTAAAGSGNAWTLVSTTPLVAERYTQGFAYGSRALSNNSDGYLYRNGTGRTFPFTQVYLRPRLSSDGLDYPAIPDSGTAERAVAARPDNVALDQTWGVAGSGDGRSTLYNDEVLAFTQAGDRMIVGGNFRYAQRGANDADRVPQPFLAAFDVDTAQFLPGFDPRFNGQVKALETLPSGLIVAGGEFTKVNGVDAAGIVALDPVNGEVATGWRVSLENTTRDGKLFVRTLELRGDDLYVGGSFTHLSRGSTRIYARNAARVDAATGQPDATWRPEFNGSVNDLSVAPDGNRIYLVGYFTQVNGAAAEKVAVLRASDAEQVAGLAAPTFTRDDSNYQQGVAAVGDRVFYGGAEHMLFGVDADTFERTSSSVTRQGGDFQGVTAYGGLVLAGCHCNQYNYQDGTTWPGARGWTRVAMIRYLGAYDAVTGEHVSDFYPEGITTRAGHGAWAIEADSRGTIWVGGDFTGVRNRSGATQWTGGFLRLPQRDVTPPTAPSGLELKRNAQDPSLLNVNFTGSTDSSGRPVSYEILLEDRVAFLRNSRSSTIPMPPAGTRIFVRAIDKEGNRSASTPAQSSPG